MVVPEDIATALETGNVAAVRHWLTSGAGDANDVIGEEWTPLQRTLIRTLSAYLPWAQQEGDSRVEMIRLLIEHGADVNYNANGNHPIFHCGSAEEVRVLLDAGVDVDVRTQNTGMTTLMFYSQFAPTFPAIVDIAKFLVKRGANLSLTCYMGLDAEEYARRIAENVQARHLVDWLADVRRAGGYQKFVREPRVALARLHLLCERGRASPPDGATKEDRALERLFGPRTPLPRGVFWLVVQYWRSDRDV